MQTNKTDCCQLTNYNSRPSNGCTISHTANDYDRIAFVLPKLEIKQEEYGKGILSLLLSLSITIGYSFPMNFIQRISTIYLNHQRDHLRVLFSINQQFSKERNDSIFLSKISFASNGTDYFPKYYDSPLERNGATVVHWWFYKLSYLNLF